MPLKMQLIKSTTNVSVKVDKNIGWQHSVKIERKVCAVVFVIVLMTLAIIASHFCVWLSRIRKWDTLYLCATINYICLFVMRFIMIILELQFVVAASFVQVRLRAVNNALVVITNNNDSSVVTSPLESVHRLTLSYGTLCDAVQLVNDSYGCPLLYLVVAILEDLVVMLHFVIVEILTSSFQVNTSAVLSLWCILDIVRILIIVEPCYNTVNEKKNTERLVSRLMTAAPPTGLLTARLQLFSKQLMLWSVSYTPLGFFTLDRTLLTAAIGAITTYLVIFIQLN